MWFDVGIKRYTTIFLPHAAKRQLWFDVGIKRYTTIGRIAFIPIWLWFDVGIKRYTTYDEGYREEVRCGLM